jgi:hypothetical protein
VYIDQRSLREGQCEEVLRDLECATRASGIFFPDEAQYLFK